MTEDMTEIQKRIIELKKQRNALILAHNYQTMDIQQVADFVGDSLQLAKKSAEVSGYDMIVFCGVKFMAEMTAVLSKGTPVYIPAPKALCPLAAYIDANKIRSMKEKYPDAPVVIYVNTTAESKTETDVICTSGSAVEVVRGLDADTVLFGPDANLADYVRANTNVEVIDIEPRGHCYVHNQFDVAQIMLLKEEHPDAIAIAHPECPREVQEAADMIGSTGMMVKTVAESPAKKFIIATELGLVHQLQAAHPDKEISPVYEGAVCRQMKKNTIEKVLHVLECLPKENLVTVPDEMAAEVETVLAKINQVRGQGPATAVGAD
jgi:quinolinate synthase